MDQKSAEAYVRLANNSDGRVLLKNLADEFDKAMKGLLYAKPEDIFTAQGHARALHEQLKKFSDAEKHLRG
jgi:hypothetical protein